METISWFLKVNKSKNITLIVTLFMTQNVVHNCKAFKFIKIKVELLAALCIINEYLIMCEAI